ncbi:arabinogalactan endo-1,4-beta-galactosidase [Spiroplasma chinense]|uniref:Arabinogalactan endo-beta-1,4-galactanase n=1 Tax=Spiroplasma chinense TaxID=216932 RepID=A0A5B9Y421_9MOLU|nr:glycosyl hydrolase 53 family protein [Spiroplasma chinense]QEH61416.1 arabinogalactan endo-1,4-beta-galactosidase [Spiroplasma chinense]
MAKLKKSSIIISSIVASSAVIGAVGAAAVNLSVKDNEQWYRNVFKNIEVKNDEMIKGADISSYAEILEQSTMKDGKFTPYNVLSEDQKNVYYNFDGKKDNLMKILSENGINSIRLRVWNNPYDKDGNSYGGGHNDMDTNIWIAKEAAKVGIKDVVLDFHYSDFWADPNRQYLPKAWEGLNEVELKNAIQTYTYDSLTKFKKELGFAPSIVQLGNEITNGAFWSIENNAPSGWRNIVNTADYLNWAAKGVEQFEVESNTKVKKAIHIDGTPSPKRFIEIVGKYLNEGKNKDWVDEIGITHYPDWNGSAVKLFDIMTGLKKKFGLNSYVSEFAATYTFDSTNEVGDISGSQTKDYQAQVKTNSGAQIKLVQSVMEASSKALPNAKTGFYWWEPAWIFSGKSGWATREGIVYSEPLNEENQKSFMTGNSWWNRGVFNKDAKPLPVLKAIAGYSRTKQEKSFDANEIYSGIYSGFMKDDSIYKNLKVIDNGLFLKDSTTYKEAVDKTEFTYTSFKEYKANFLNDFKNEDSRAVIEQVDFDFSQENSKSSSFIVKSKAKENSYMFKDEDDSVDFKINITPRTNKFIEMKNKINISSKDTGWLNEIYKQVIKNTDDLNSLIKELKTTITKENGCHDYCEYDIYSGNDIHYYDDFSGKERWYKTWIANDSKGYDIVDANNTIDFETIGGLSHWRDTLSKDDKELMIYFTKEVDFDLYGIENWKDLKTVAVKFKLNVTE